MTETLSAQFDRLPPHDSDAEKCLIASMMIDQSVIPAVLQMVNRDAFYGVDHQIYFDVITTTHRAGKPTDSVIVRNALKSKGLWEEVGGNEYLTTLLTAVPSAAHALHYAGIVREKSIGRQLIVIANDTLREAYGSHEQEWSFLDLAKTVERSSASLIMTGVAHTVITLEIAAIELYEERERGDVRRIPTGLSELDALVGGLPIGKFTEIAGRAGMGKSQLAKQIVLNMAERGEPAGLVSIEEDRRKIATNMIANLSDLNNDHLTYGVWTKEDWASVAATIQRLSGKKFHIADSVEKLSQIEAMITLMAVKHKCRAVFVDHIHLADAETKENRERQVALISKGLKGLAKRLDIAVVGLCQLNRGAGGADEYNKRPQLRDLRDSGSLEADGDLIIMLHREDYYRAREPGYELTRRLEALIRKNKDGPSGEVPLLFDGDHQRITNWTGGPEIIQLPFGD